MKTLPSGLPEEVSDCEPLARFLVHSNYFVKENGLVKPDAFMPHPKYRNTSVSRHDSSPLERLKGIGHKVVGPDGHLYGAAVTSAKHVRDAKLEVVADEDDGLEFHANIVNWFWDETDKQLQKSIQKKIATSLAADAKLLLFNNGAPDVVNGAVGVN